LDASSDILPVRSLCNAWAVRFNTLSLHIFLDAILYHLTLRLRGVTDVKFGEDTDLSLALPRLLSDFRYIASFQNCSASNAKFRSNLNLLTAVKISGEVTSVSVRTKGNQ